MSKKLLFTRPVVHIADRVFPNAPRVRADDPHNGYCLTDYFRDMYELARTAGASFPQLKPHLKPMVDRYIREVNLHMARQLPEKKSKTGLAPKEPSPALPSTTSHQQGQPPTRTPRRSPNDPLRRKGGQS